MGRLRFQQNILNIFASLALVGCSWDRFSDLADQAPALMIEQKGDISSASFGDQLAGMDRASNAAGGALFLSGNAEATVATVLISPDGTVNYTQAEKDTLKDHLDAPNQIASIAAVPPLLATTSGPFAYVGSYASDDHAIRVVDIGRYTDQTTIKPNDNWSPSKVTKFGLSVTAAEFGMDSHFEDLAAGASDAVVLLKATTWPSFGPTPIVLSADTAGMDWPKGDYTQIASGELVDNADLSKNHEVVAAVPDKNSVVVIYDVKSSCFTDDKEPPELCAKILRLDNQSTSGFGSSLLIADVDQTLGNELVVGAAKSSKVFIFSFEIEETGSGTTKTRTLKATLKKTLTADGSQGLGTSLAFGTWLNGTEEKLAVGAPGTTVDGVTGVGSIYFFDKNLDLIATEGTSFVSPQENTRLGLSLTRIPFRANNNDKPQFLLAASAREMVYIFFAQIAGEVDDVRVR